MPRFSVIIPTYNRSASLKNCLASVRAEAGYDGSIEIIVADDGSSRAEAARNRAIGAASNIVMVGDGANHGMAVARNRGIAAARGEWLVFLDDDVTCNAGWFAALEQAVDTCSPDTVAIEGCIHPSGNGVWDREVQNMSGGACLTSHFIIRRKIIGECGVFDAAFEHIGPYCEDHEFASRVMKCGRIAFVAHCAVTHAPRNVPLVAYILKAPRRCYKLLLADRYFYYRQPEGYALFRRYATFAETYRSYRVRHLISVLRRRKIATLIAHPLQSSALFIAALVEQVTAWVVLPAIVKKPLRSGEKGRA